MTTNGPILSLLAGLLVVAAVPAQPYPLPVPAPLRGQLVLPEVVEPVLPPTMAVTLANADGDQQNSVDQVFYRYLYKPYPKGGEAAVEAFEAALKLHVNLISRESAFAYPKLIAPGLCRVDLRNYQWNPKVWEKLADIDPYFHRVVTEDVIEEFVEEKKVKQAYGYTDAYGHTHITEYRDEVKKEKRVRRRQISKRKLFVPNGAAQLAGLALLTGSDAPIVRADWFLVQSARQTSLDNLEDTGVGYYDFLGVRDRDDYFRLIGFNEGVLARFQSEVRSVVGESGVAQGNRQIVVEGGVGGHHYTTLEVKTQKGRGVAIANLRKNEFLHAAEEHYAPLPNGLPATFLSDDKGVRQSSVPDFVAGNKSELNVSHDTRVHVNMACMQCHEGNVLMPIEDDVRPVYTGRLKTNTNSDKVFLELKRQYGTYLERMVNKDRADYQDKFKEVTGLAAKQAAAVYSKAFTDYAVGRIDLAGAAIEYGVRPDMLFKAFSDAAVRQGKGDFRFDPFLAPAKRTIPRLNFEDGFQDGQDYLFGVLIQQQIEEVGPRR